jgi:hypothetical protein
MEEERRSEKINKEKTLTLDVFFKVVLFIKSGIHNYIKVKIRGIFTISYKAA